MEITPELSGAIYIISLVINIVVLIVFITMAVNINKIKSVLMLWGLEKKFIIKYKCNKCHENFIYIYKVNKPRSEEHKCSNCGSKEIEEIL